ncbi:MAG: hypothetical protein ACSLFO_04575 [Acidimicrobiales bacterium]
MAARGRVWRSVTAVLVGVLAVLGTIVGTDDWFPFTPMSQYAYAVDPDGRTSTHVVEAIGLDGHPVPITYHDLDMRPAELEGLLRPLATRSERLGAVLATFRLRRPDAPPTVGIRYLRTVVQLDDRRPIEARVVELGRFEDRT